MNAPVSKSAVDKKIRKASELHRAGKLQEAAKLYRQVLQMEPDHAGAMLLLAMVAEATGQKDEALSLAIRSLQIRPDNPTGINFLGNLLKSQGRYDDAIEIFVGGLESFPANYEILNNLGLTLEAAGRYEEAEEVYKRVIALKPDQFAPYNNLGNVYRKLRRLRESIQCYEKALSLSPQSAVVWINLGIVLKDAGQYDQAETIFQKVIKLDPNQSQAHSALAGLYRMKGNLQAAIVAYRKAVEVEPENPILLNNLGNALMDARLYNECLVCFNRAVRLKPDYALAYSNLGAAYTFMGRSEEGIPYFRKALELDPANESAINNLLFALNYVGKCSKEELYAEHCRFEELFGARYRARWRPHSNERDPQRRLKVGYVSGDLRNHAVARFVEPIFKNHNRTQFELYAYSNCLQEDETTEHLKGYFDHWRCVVPYTDDELAELIRQDGIDILVDLSGHTALNRLLVFARKPAPVQFTMIGYMQTTGLKAIDYRITDTVLDDPATDPQRFSSEKLVYLKSGAAPFQPPPNAPEVNDLPALANGHITYASFNNLAKATPKVYETWAAILHQVPDARMLMVGNRETILKEFSAFGIDESRLEILPRQPVAEYYRLHHRVDFILDTFPYTGGTTNLIALWMGIPYVTLKGNSGVSRAGAGILRLLPFLKELVSDTTEEYISKAVSMARNLEQLAEWRKSMRPVLAGKFDWMAKRFTEELEEAYRKAWGEWCTTPQTGA